MNTGAPGQKSKLVESFLLLSLFRLPLRPPSAWPANRCVRLCSRARRAEPRGCGDSGGTPGHPRAPTAPHPPTETRNFSIPGQSLCMKPEGSSALPCFHPVLARSCPCRFQDIPGQSRGCRGAPRPQPRWLSRRECPARRSAPVRPEHTWAHRLCPAASPEPRVPPGAAGSLLCAADSLIYSHCFPNALASRDKTLRRAGCSLLPILPPN